jgi:hypothetical protein
VRREFKFWVIESSIVLRERRRKSKELGISQSVAWIWEWKEVPRRAVWLKQNWGVREGGS